MSEKRTNQPLTYKIGLWYGFILSGMFLLYGGVQIVLSFLDRNYSSIGQLIFYTIVGLILITFALAYKELKQWGWYGLIAINGLVVVLGLIGFQKYENIILLVISVGVIISLLAKSTKNYLSR